MLKASFSSIVGNFFNSNETADKNVESWKQLITQALNRVNQLRQILDESETFAFYQGHAMGGCYIGLFAKRRILDRIKDLYVCKVKAGMGGLTKNKGSTALRFKIDDTTFAFLNCHLSAGKGEVEKRAEMLKMILEQAFKKAKGLYDAYDHDVIFIFGDLNFRLELKNKDARDAILSENIDYLKQFDELLCIRNADQHFNSGHLLELTEELRGELVKNDILAMF